jgi:hypothetical protein
MAGPGADFVWVRACRGGDRSGPATAARRVAARAGGSGWRPIVDSAVTAPGGRAAGTATEAGIDRQVRHQGPGPPGGRPVHRRLQPPAPAQQLPDAAAGRLRGSARRASRSSGPRKPSRMKPASQTAVGRLDPTRWHQGAGECEAPPAISNPPRFRGKPTRLPGGRLGHPGYGSQPV